MIGTSAVEENADPPASARSGNCAAPNGLCPGTLIPAQTAVNVDAATTANALHGGNLRRSHPNRGPIDSALVEMFDGEFGLLMNSAGFVSIGNHPKC